MFDLLEIGKCVQLYAVVRQVYAVVIAVAVLAALGPSFAGLLAGLPTHDAVFNFFNDKS